MSKFVEGDGVNLKDPEDTLDYTIDWGPWLAGDTINTSVWVVAAGLTEDSDTNSTTAATVWISGGTPGGVYPVTNRITTTAGRATDRTLILQVEEK